MRLSRADLVDIITAPPVKRTPCEQLASALAVFEITGKRPAVRAWLNDGTFYHSTKDKQSLLRAARQLGLAVIRIDSAGLFRAECQPLGPSIDMALASGRVVA